MLTGQTVAVSSMIKVKRISHATFETPDVERQTDYYTSVVGLVPLTKDKDRVLFVSRLGDLSVILTRFLAFSLLAFISALRAAIGSLCATTAVTPAAIIATASTMRFIMVSFCFLAAPDRLCAEPPRAIGAEWCPTPTGHCYSKLMKRSRGWFTTS